MKNILSICVALFLLGVVTAQDVTRLLAKYKDPEKARREMFQRLHPNGGPDFSKLKKASTPVSYATSYSSGGFVAFSYFTDDQCTEAIFTTGFPVNTCFIEVGYAYMVRLAKDSCMDGVVEYFYDKKCTKSAGTSDLTESGEMGGCFPFFPGVFSGSVCTTSSQPKVYMESVVTKYYRGDSCGTMDSYLAVPANQCMPSDGSDDEAEDIMFTCDGGLKVVSYVAGSDCGERVGSFTSPDMCYETSDPNADDDDDGFFDDVAGDDDDDGFFDDVAGDDGTNKNLPAPTVRSRIISTPAEQKVGAKAKTAPRAVAKAHNPSLRAADSNKQALALVPTDDDVNYGDDGGDDDRGEYYYDDDTYSSGYAYSYDDGASIGGGILNPPPSVSTTPFPTTTAEGSGAEFSLRLVCQAAPQKSTVVFTAKQTIDGVSFSDYSDNKAAYEKTFKQAIASAISGATEDSVTNLVVTAGTTAAATALAPAQFIKRMLSGSSLSISYTVTISDTTLSVETLMAQLVTAVETGSFTNAMQSYAAENGADGLTTATSDSVTTESQDDEEETATLSTGAIIGIAVGGGVFVLGWVIFAIVYSCSAKRSQSVMPQ